MCDNLDPRGSVQCTNTYSGGNSYQRYHSAVNEIPVCSAVDYCHAAAFRLKLPGCESYNEQNEYLAFIIPQKNQDKKPPSPKPVECKPYYEEKSDISATQYIPRYSPSRRWNTEYRSTIDDCAKKRMTTVPKTSRNSSSLQNCHPNTISEFPARACSRSVTRQSVEKPCSFAQHSMRTQNLCHEEKLVKCEQTRICKKGIEVGRLASRKTPISKSVSYNNNDCHEQNVIPRLSTSSDKRPLNKCFPIQGSSNMKNTLQRSTRRPMPRCQFQSCR